MIIKKGRWIRSPFLINLIATNLPCSPNHGRQEKSNILPPKEFAKRLIKYAAFSIALVIILLGIGILGYHYLGSLG
jgi:hypothetical protein